MRAIGSNVSYDVYTIVNVVLHDHDINFRSNNFLVMHFLYKKYAQIADVPDRFASTCMAPALELLLLIHGFAFVKQDGSRIIFFIAPNSMKYYLSIARI